MGLWRAFRRSALAGLALSLVAMLPRTAAAASANELFGEVDGPTAAREPEVIGSYSRGCLRGAVELPATGPGWEVMRTSRNRNWGHPSLIAFVERLAAETRRAGGPGILVGDMAQPRGGPLRYGHASHQIGLDVDVWLTPPPNRILTPDERESLLAVSMVEDDRYAIDPDHFGRFQAALIRRAATFPEVERVFVNPGIKKALCATADDGERDWLGKLRPWWGHDDHLHVRLRFPGDQPQCREQDPPPDGDGCGTDLRRWLGQTPYKPKDLLKPTRPVPLAALPAACREVLREP
jgi:penicillin-insensitive murein DD-endopeptidase